MDMKEHIYTDDPKIGPPDVRTSLADVDYFFIGNGFIQAAVQVCRSGEATPLGLLIMDPERFGPKREALTCDPSVGLENTVVEVCLGEKVHVPTAAGVDARWTTVNGAPAVRATWPVGSAAVVESFYCLDRSKRQVIRRLDIQLPPGSTGKVILRTKLTDSDHELPLDPSADGPATVFLIYEIAGDNDEWVVSAEWKQNGSPDAEATAYWNGLNRCTTGDSDLDSLFATSRYQLPTAVDAAGRMDASIWQYNLEWVRDEVHVAEALIRLGDYGLARTMLARLLDEFVSPDGAVIDSGRHRPPEEIELDQNGELLTALRTYVDWTGDLDLVRSRWSIVEALVSFPLRDQFRHEASGLLHNQREFWERHGGHGILDGCELMHQFFVAMGLENAVYLSEATGCVADREAWRTAASNLRHAFLENPEYSLIENGHFIKRRGLDGVWQQTITPSAECILPPEIPLMEAGPRPLEPDTSSVLPIVYSFIDPGSELAASTLTQMEELWNQRWESGGYGRYNAGSEADSAGAWPFASLHIARACVETGDDAKVWRVLRWLASAPGGIAGTWFEFDGPRIAPPYAQVGVTPWTWAEMVSLYVHHLLGVRPDLQGITVRPYLLDGLDRMDASVQVQGHRLELKIRRAASETERGAQVGAERFEWQDNGVRLPPPESDVDVMILC